MTNSVAAEIAKWQQSQEIKKVSKKITLHIPSSTAKLKTCSTALQVEAAKGLPFGRIQRKISCTSEGWSLYVRAKVALSAYIPVANKTLKRDEVVTSENLQCAYNFLLLFHTILATEKLGDARASFVSYNLL